MVKKGLENKIEEEEGLNLKFLQENRGFFQMETYFPKSDFCSQKVTTLLSCRAVNFWSSVVSSCQKGKVWPYFKLVLRHEKKLLRTYSVCAHSHRGIRWWSSISVQRHAASVTSWQIWGLAECVISMLVWEEKHFGGEKNGKMNVLLQV